MRVLGFGHFLQIGPEGQHVANPRGDPAERNRAHMGFKRWLNKLTLNSQCLSKERFSSALIAYKDGDVGRPPLHLDSEQNSTCNLGSTGVSQGYQLAWILCPEPFRSPKIWNSRVCAFRMVTSLRSAVNTHAQAPVHTRTNT